MRTLKENDPGLLGAFERLAAREAGGGMPDHGVGSEKDRILAESEGPDASKRHQFERLYDSPELEGGYRWSVLKIVLVLVGLGSILAFAAFWLNGLPG